jgi:F-type H+-transporting ATPase subunit epsilon
LPEPIVPEPFQCTLVTPEAQVLDEQVVYASIPAWDGLIGVEARRAPLMAKLGDGVLRLDFAKGGARVFFVGGGFAQMKDNRLTLLAAEAIPATDIVGKDADAALAQARELTGSSDEAVARKRRLIERAKTLRRLFENRASLPG